MQWPDAGLGCAPSGESRAQVITRGWLVEIRVANKTLEYHTDGTASKIVLCKESG